MYENATAAFAGYNLIVLANFDGPLRGHAPEAALTDFVDHVRYRHIAEFGKDTIVVFLQARLEFGQQFRPFRFDFPPLLVQLRRPCFELVLLRREI